MIVAQDPDQRNTFPQAKILAMRRAALRQAERDTCGAKKAIAHQSASTWILSSEHLNSRLGSSEIRRLASALSQLAIN
jgi:hypothetical protein